MQTPTATPDAPTAAPAEPAWRELTGVSAGPSPRSDHTWTIGADGSIAYLFGGRTGDGSSGELWQFDLDADAWSQVMPATPGPDARWGHTGTWVPGVGLVIWSGQNENGFFGDLWRFDPMTSSWAQLQATGDVPEARYGSCAALGRDGRLWISHGFTEDDGRFADTRAYDFATAEWSDLTPTGRVPLERCLHDCFWSVDGSQFVLYGGQTTGVAALGDAWGYEATSGDWTASADGAAPPRQLFAMAPTASGALVFGGSALDGAYLGDAWLLNAVTLELTPFGNGPGPSERAGATLVADVLGRRWVLFGGQGDDGLMADMWALTNT